MSKILISIFQKYEMFDIGRHLSKMNKLHSIYTTYPKFNVKKYINNVELIHSYPLYEVLFRLNYKLWNNHNFFSNFDFFLIDHFDRFISKKVNNSKDLILLSQNGFSYHTFLKNHNCIKVLYQTSMHIDEKIKILSNIGYKPENIINKKTYTKFKKEYLIADKIICTSENTYESFLNKPEIKCKIEFNLPGTDGKKFFFDNNYYDYSEKELKIIYVGRISKRKGINILLVAIKILIEQNIKIKFTIIGSIESDMREYVFQFINKNKNIKYIPSIKNEKLFEYYSKNDLFCLPSNEEGNARVIFESLACGVFVIASKNSGAKTILNENNFGLLMRKNDVQELINLIKKYILYKEIHLSKRQINSKLFISKYSWKESSTSLYKKLIN